ncbi:transketolase [Methanoregula sp. UBA64]|uniref:transketolase n=1 Tax=Methanoregula sp. UBA64 TaxID=1915554 RepID=UPI0025F37579|nr:transketolase [Methanoregula sp. UBA64]
MSKQSIDLLSRQIRTDILEIAYETESIHVGSCLSCVDLLIALYYQVLSVRPEEPNWPLRDRFILSKGHAALALYAVLAHRGYYPIELVHTFNQNKSRFTAHPVWKNIPGIDATSGSLGHGLGIGCGMALAAKISGQKYRTFVLVGDGECEEGSIWEAALFAPAHHLNNLVVIIDSNKWQASGRSDEILNLSSLKQKLSEFGWDAYEIDGHDINGMTDLFYLVFSSQERPIAIIANTIKGKGVSFMENDNQWHNRVPSKEDVWNARRELVDL